MLLEATMIVNLLAMAVTLWMGFYLFARGFPSVIAFRVVVVMLALSGFYYGAYNNIFAQVSGSAAIRAVLLVIVLGGWYSVTFHVMSERNQQKYRFIEWGIYGLGALSIPLLLQPSSFILEEGNALYVAHMNNTSWAYRVYGFYQFVVSFGIMLNLLVGDRVGLTPRGKYFFVASFFPVASVIYGVISLGSPEAAPRLIQDSLAFCGVFVLGLSVARHQTWTERRTTFQDFPLTTLATLGLAGLAALFAWNAGLAVERLSTVVGLVVLWVGIYDLTREFLERQRDRKESTLRKQFSGLETAEKSLEALKSRLQDGLDLLCDSIEAPGGFVAIRQDEGRFVVLASRASVGVGRELSVTEVGCDDLSQPATKSLASLAWLAPSFEGRFQVAVVGIEQARARLEYSSGNLELLAEVADQIGTLVSLSHAVTDHDQPDSALAEDTPARKELNSATGKLMDTISANNDIEFIKSVEEALRNLHDTITLGESPLAEKMSIEAESHVERGKRLQEIITVAIDMLRPADERPSEPLPRVWYNHAVLYDAYVEGVPNREIMARLYISEGTFNRTRRNAIRGLARMLIEQQN